VDLKSKQKGFLGDFFKKEFLFVAVLSSGIVKGRQQKDKLFVPSSACFEF